MPYLNPVLSAHAGLFQPLMDLGWPAAGPLDFVDLIKDHIRDESKEPEAQYRVLGIGEARETWWPRGDMPKGRADGK